MWYLAILESTVLLISIYVLSEEYISFLRNRGLGWRSILILIIFIMLVVGSALIVINWYLVSGGYNWVLIIVFISIMIPVIVKYVKNTSGIENAVSKKLAVDGEEVEYYVYTDGDVTAFYNFSSRKIYLHEKLEEVLDKNELMAILYHEYRRSLQASRRPYSIILVFTYYAVLLWIPAGFIISALASYIVGSMVFAP